jgi:hypothetical protein
MRLFIRNFKNDSVGRFTLTGSLEGEPEYDSDEYQCTKVEWLLTINGLVLNQVLEGKLGQWHESNTVKCTRYGTSPAKTYIGGSARVRYTFEKKDDSSVTHTSEGPSGSVLDAARPIVWVVGIDRLDFRFAGDNDSQYRTLGEIVVLQGSAVRFKAFRTPVDAPNWPSGMPVWSGTAGASGTGETKDLTCSTLSTSATDFKTVITSCGASSKTVNVYVVKAELAQVSFLNDHMISRDNGSSYGTPHWEKGRTPERYPVGYTSGNEIKVKAIFKCEPNKALTTGVKIRARAYGAYPAQVGNATVSGSNITTDELSCGRTTKQKVDYISCNLEWWFESLNAQFDQKIGANRNRLYITLKEPQGLRRETLYELACKNRGATNNSTCIANTWQSFSGTSVIAWDAPDSFNRPLCYYRTFDGDEKTSAEEMLENINPDPAQGDQGQCHAWADMFKEALQINGVASNFVTVLPPTGYIWFGVKNIGFGSGPGPYPSVDTAPKGIRGQNMDTPAAKLFGNHFIVKAGGSFFRRGTYYDPSYGATATSAANYSGNAIDALYKSPNWEKRTNQNLQFSQ